MSVIIRLQNLPWTANALDIRRFFGGLHIPDGGVHIVGGDKGDAFIAFGTDDDARKAMMLDGGMVNESPVKLFLSSKSEMQNVIAVARGGAPTQAEEPNSFGRPAVPGLGGGSQMGPTNLMSSHSNFGGVMQGDFNSPSRQSQPGFSASGAGGSGGQFGRENQNQMSNYGENRQQGAMGNFGGPSQPLGGSTNQGFNQSNQSSWDRPMQSNISSPPTGGDFGMQQNQMGSFGGRDNNFGNRDRGRDSGFGNMNTFSGSGDTGRQSSSFGGQNMSSPMGGSSMSSSVGGSTMPSFNRDNQSSMGGGMGGNLGGNLGGSMGSGMGGSFGNMSRDAPKREPYMERPREETNIFLQPRDQVRPQTGNIFLQGRDLGRSSSMMPSSGNYNSSSGGNFNSARPNSMGAGNRSGGMSGGNQPGGVGGGNRPGGMGGGSRPGGMGGGNHPSGMGGGNHPSGMGGGNLPSGMGGGNHPSGMGGGNHPSGMGGGNHPSGMGGASGMGGGNHPSGMGGGNHPSGMGGGNHPSGMGGSMGSGMGGGMGGGNNLSGMGGNMGGGNHPSGMGGNMGGGNMFQDNSRDRGNRSFQESQDRFQMQDQGNQRGFQDNRGGNRSFQDNRNMGSNNRHDDRRSSSDRRREPEVHIIMDGFPSTVNYREIRRFFGNSSEIVRDGVKMINDKFGARIGKAYIKLVTEQDAQNALRRNGEMISGSRVKIQKCSSTEYAQAVDSYRPPPGSERRKSPMKREASHEPGRRRPSPKRERAPSPKARAPSPKSRAREEPKPKAFSKPRDVPKPKEEPKPKTYPKEEPKPKTYPKEEPKSKTYPKEEPKPKVVSKSEPSPKPKPAPKKEPIPVVKMEASPKPKAQSPTKRPRSRSGTPPRKRPASDSGENCCMLLKNLPFKASKLDIKKFFFGLRIAHRGGPYLETRTDGKHTGTAFVQFETAKEAEESMSNDGKPLMGRSVEMVPISKREFEENVRSLRSNTPEPKEPEKEAPKPREGSQNGGSKTDDFKFYCIKMKGLPFSATNQTVREFFDGLEIASRGVHLIYNSQKQAAGTAFVEFVTTRDCKKATAKNKQNMGKRYILVEAMSKKDMLEQQQQEQKLQREKHNEVPPSLLDSIGMRGSMGNAMGGMGNNMGGMGNNMGGMGNNMGGMGNNMGGMGNNMNKGGGFMGDKDNRGGNRLVPIMVQLQNLPFKVTLDEVLGFFRGYGPVRSSFKLDERDGRPTGKAIIGFHNQEQQQRALNELNRKQLLGRPIHIHPADRF